MTLSENALVIALSQVGVQEEPKGSNSGPKVNQYLKRIGLPGGYAWCMAFVYWCVDEACKEMELVNPLVKTGGVMYQYNTTKLRKIPNRASGAKPGDIFIMKFSGGRGHTGFIEKIEGGIAHTVEGNTNDEGSREGYEVARMKRPLSSFHGIIQLP